MASLCVCMGACHRVCVCVWVAPSFVGEAELFLSKRLTVVSFPDVKESNWD